MEHLLRFREILDKHGLSSEKNAEKIAEYVTNHKEKLFSADEFAKDFNIPSEDAKIILEVIYKASKLRKN